MSNIHTADKDYDDPSCISDDGDKYQWNNASHPEVGNFRVYRSHRMLTIRSLMAVAYQDVG